jgi:hypothetical protein
MTLKQSENKNRKFFGKKKRRRLPCGQANPAQPKQAHLAEP